jgi:hypothetical protein
MHSINGMSFVNCLANPAFGPDRIRRGNMPSSTPTSVRLAGLQPTVPTVPWICAGSSSEAGITGAVFNGVVVWPAGRMALGHVRSWMTIRIAILKVIHTMLDKPILPQMPLRICPPHLRTTLAQAGYLAQSITTIGAVDHTTIQGLAQTGFGIGQEMWHCWPA